MVVVIDCFEDGASGGGRTHTLLRVPDFESSASANSATLATGVQYILPGDEVNNVFETTESRAYYGIDAGAERDHRGGQIQSSCLVKFLGCW